MLHYLPPENLAGTIFDPHDETFGPLMGALQAGDFERARDLLDALIKEDDSPPTRWAVVRLARDRTEVEVYLPDNYRVISTHLAEPVAGGRVHVVIEGQDVLGWTLDGYVLPRLASGNLHGREYPTYADAVDAAAASLN